jgi:penicillin-binding protein 1C
LAIESPADGSTYLIDPTLRREFQALSLRAVSAADGPIEWFIDGVSAGTSASRSSLDWPLTPGKHRITARDRNGRTVHSTIDVR